MAERRVATITAREIEALLSRLRDGDAVKRPRPYMANRLYSHFADFFKWLSRPGGPLTTSPMLGIETPWDGAKPRERDWFVGTAGDDAVKAIWRAAEAIGGDEGRYLKVLLLSGKRRGALAAMRSQEIDGTWFWNAPPSTAKNKRLHSIPLPKLAQRIVHPRQTSGPVFGGVSEQEFDFEQLTECVRKAYGVGDFFLHGLRHLAESKTAELQVPPHIRDRLFDHAPNRGSGGGYDHHAYRAEMLSALESWAAHVEHLVSAEGAALLR